MPPAARAPTSFPLLLIFLDMPRAQRQPDERRDDDGEDDRLLEGARPERRISLQQSERHGADDGERIARHPAEDRADETLEADEEAGVVIDGGDRRNQDAGKRADEGGEQEAQSAGEAGADADEPRADAVDRRGAQRLAV